MKAQLLEVNLQVDGLDKDILRGADSHWRKVEDSSQSGSYHRVAHLLSGARRGRDDADVDAAVAYVNKMGAPIVVKADGLAAGKGVIVATTEDEATDAIRDMLAGNAFGEAGHRVVVEEFLQGEEASFIVMAGGKQVLPMATSQDHKRVGDGDTGPNPGGMGAYTPAPVGVNQRHWGGFRIGYRIE